jgi:glucosyl-3-phosphoglycerate synthase
MDFFQGRLTTVHDFGIRDRKSLLEDLNAYSDERKVGLVVPALLQDTRADSFDQIIHELRDAEFINELIVPLSAESQSQVDEVRQRLSGLPFNARVLWCEHPTVVQLVNELSEKGIDITTRTGKGYAVWLGIGVAALNNNAVVFHDADIRDYSVDIAGRLAYPLLNKDLDFVYSKAFYSRLTDGKFYGRVVRLFVWPFLDSLMKINNHPSEFLQYLRSFRYPLSGEFALSSDLAMNVRIPTDWGLEMSLLSEVYRNTSLKRVCQVDLGTYSHKHRQVGSRADRGLLRMVRDIIFTTLRTYTETEGFIANPATFRALQILYRRSAQEYILKYFVDAAANGLNYERHREEATIESFASVITEAGQRFMEDPGRDQIPDWLRTVSAKPDMHRLIKATTRRFHNINEADELTQEAA